MALQPRRVLEIGVGSGLVLAQIAPECDEYWATDFSAPTIQTLRAAVAAQPWGDRVRLRVQPADVADGLPEGHFDVVVLNSVIQYFPSTGYLPEALVVAMRSLPRAGRCSSATSATTACKARCKPVSRSPAPPQPMPLRSANESTAPCSANPNYCWPQSFSRPGPPSSRRWPDSTSKSNADRPTTNSPATATTSPSTPPHPDTLPGHRSHLGVDPMRRPARTARPVDIPTARRRPHHRDPPRRTDHRRGHRTGPRRRAPPVRRTRLPKPPRPPTPSPPKNCTASAKPPDTTSPSPGAPSPAPSMPSSSPPPTPAAHPAADRPLPAPRRGPPSITEPTTPTPTPRSARRVSD